MQSVLASAMVPDVSIPALVLKLSKRHQLTSPVLLAQQWGM